MDLNESLEADWIQIRAILKAQVKRLRQAELLTVPGKTPEVARLEAMERAQRLISECEKVISSYSVKV
jgi:hypothetical protein